MANWFRRASTPGATEPANIKAAQGKPLLLIGFNDSTRSWEVGQEALTVLQGIQSPLCTISVCGRARQGKSFLLNQILGRFTGMDIHKPNGFVVSPTHQSCTRGIWIWSVPVVMTTLDGQKCNTVLMDCEGVDAVDQGQQHSAQIFSLAVLLSSVFIYNQTGAIDAIAIERLAMVCELAKRIKDKSLPAGARGKNGQVDFSPAFIWLLRDFQLRLERDGHQITPSEYLEESLQPMQGNAADIANRNQMRATIKAVFPDRDVATIVRPALSEQILQTLDTTPNNQLRPEFKKDMDVLMKLLAAKARPLEVGVRLVSGSALAALAKAYVTAVNQGAVPQLVTAWQGISRAETQKAYDAAAAAYAQEFSPSDTMEEQQLYEHHQTALTAALDQFKTSAMGDPDLLSEFESKLRQQLEAQYVEAKKKLAASGERLATEMLAAETVKLRELMAKPNVTVDAIESELCRFLDEYDLKVVSGPYKYKKAAEFLMNTTIIGIKGIVKDIVAARDSAAKRAETAEATVAQLRKEVARLADAEDRSADALAELQAAKQETARLQGQLESKSRHITTLESQLTAAREADAVSAAAQEQVKQELAAARGEGERLKAQIGEMERLRQQLQHLQDKLAEAGQKEMQALAAKAAAQQEASRLVEQVKAQESRVAQLQAEAAGGRIELDNLRATITDLRKQIDNSNSAEVDMARVQGQLEEERKKVTQQMEEIAKLTQQLISERKDHDTTKDQLNVAKAAARSGGSMRSPGASPATSAGAGAASGAGRSRKRQRTSAVASEDEAMPDVAQGTPLPVVPEEPAAQEAPAGTPAAVNKDINPDKMTVNQLKEWVTDNSLEDQEFFEMSQSTKTKKPDWVKYVKKKRAG